MRALLAQIDLPSLGREGPDDLQDQLRTFFVLFAGGFLVGVLGQLAGSRALKAAGIVMVLAGTVFFMLAVGSSG